MRLSTESVKYDLESLREKQIPLLKCIDKVCREHHLRYYLWAGTLLGAVRHQGFIPWDDDMDIAMPRPDYNLLMEHYREWMPQPYEVIGPHNRPDYPYPFAKAVDASTTLIERPDFNFPEGVFLDIFPLDGYPSDLQANKKNLSNYHFWRHLLFLRGRDPFKHGKGPRSWWPLLIHKLFTLKWIQNKVQDIMTQYDYEESDHVIDHDFNERGIIRKSWLGEPKLHEFEGEEYMGPADADAYLTHIYGDYMTLPPKEKQVQHVYLYLNLTLPYREYARQNNICIE